MSVTVPVGGSSSDAWPLKLRHQQGLRLERGEVLVLDHRLFAIVGFDGRNEGYICWPSASDGEFDTNCFVIVPRLKAHGAPRDLEARERVPPLPQLDHTGRVWGQGTPRIRTREEVSLTERPSFFPQAATLCSPASSFTPPVVATAKQSPAPTSPPCEGPQSKVMRQHSYPTYLPSTSLPMYNQVPPAAQVLSAADSPQKRTGRPGDAVQSDLVEYGYTKQCVVCVVLRLLALSMSEALNRLSGTLRRYSSSAPRSKAITDAADGESLCTPRGALSPRRGPSAQPSQHSLGNAASSSYFSWTRSSTAPAGSEGHGELALAGYCPQQRQIATGRNALQEMKITIPIVKPQNWREIQGLIDRRAVTFDERGVKERMTVRSARWSAFVDRQKEKLEKEIESARLAAKLRQAAAEGAAAMGEDGADGKEQAEGLALASEPGAQERQPEKAPEQESGADGGAAPAEAPGAQAEAPRSPRGEPDSAEDDIAELAQMVERMEDWKDLARYSGESISMASTRCGNEMKIHVLAFAEREDGAGVDFMRLSYKKSVEVCDRCPLITRGSPASLLLRTVLRTVLPALAQPQSSPGSAQESREQWIQLLQRPDVAKFTIALAFRRALENDGIRLQFCEGRLDDAEAAA